MQESEFRQILDDQSGWSSPSDHELLRDDLALLRPVPSHAFIVSGVRRCGKTTLLRQYLRQEKDQVLQLRFEDYRLAEFGLRDFGFLDACLKERNIRTLLLDEVQNIEGWEIYVRQKLDDGVRVFITGSNATLLSRELGTRLTGRHITHELAPFSFAEFCRYEKQEPSRPALEDFLRRGGFPEYLRTGDGRILNALVDGILTRDIAQRYGLRDVRVLKILCSFFFQNIGNLVSPSRLTGMAGVRSARTVLDYCGHFDASYLVHLVPAYSHSRKAQELAPKKVYAVDNGLCRTGIPADKEDSGHLLENTVYGFLRRSGGEIAYFRQADHECDFIVTAPDGTRRAVQVCWQLTADTLEREQSGLTAAMRSLGLRDGTIVTMGGDDRILTDTGTIHVVPAWKFLVERGS